jgi:hypothetical protein
VTWSTFHTENKNIVATLSLHPGLLYPWWWWWWWWHWWLLLKFPSSARTSSAVHPASYPTDTQVQLVAQWLSPSSASQSKWGIISTLPQTYGMALIMQFPKHYCDQTEYPQIIHSRNLRFSWHLLWRYHYCDTTESNADVPTFQMNLQQVSLKCWYYLPTTL